MENFMVVQNSHTVEARDKFKKTNKESWLRGIHPQPLCPYAKTKIKFVHYRKVVPLRRNKKKSIHHITRHIWLRLFSKASTHICLRYATANIRYAGTLSVRFWKGGNDDKNKELCRFLDYLAKTSNIYKKEN